MKTDPNDKNLRGIGLTVARVIWILLFILVTTIFILGIVGLYSWFSEPCIQKTLEDQPDCYTVEAALQQFGLSRDFYAFYFPVGVVVEILPFILVSLLIFWFKSHELFALLFSLLMLWYGAISQDALWTWAFFYYQPSLSEAFGRLTILFDVLLVLPFRFPDGIFVPRWMRWFSVTWILWVLFRFLSQGVIEISSWVYSVAVIIYSLAILYSFFYRFRRHADLVQQQQIKWLLAAGTAYSLVQILGELVSPLAMRSAESEVIFRLTYTPLSYLVSALAAISIGISILKYRLWEIEVIIRRTLVYGSLTVLLAAVYMGSVILAQSLLSTLTGQRQSEIGTVVATLAVAALFTPFRRRIQNIIDQRFYRRKYDAENVLNAFRDSLRVETDIDRLSEQLTSVVEETMQPEHVSLWLQEPGVKT